MRRETISSTMRLSYQSTATAPCDGARGENRVPQTRGKGRWVWAAGIQRGGTEKHEIARNLRVKLRVIKM
jgi:hypothetical protein